MASIYKKADHGNAKYFKLKLEHFTPQRLHIQDGYIEAVDTTQNIQRELQQIMQHIYAHVDDINVRAIVEQPEKQVVDTRPRKRLRM